MLYSYFHSFLLIFGSLLMTRTMHTKTDAQTLANLKGIGLMTLSMLSFTLADMSLKLASDTVTSGQIIMIIGIGCSVFFWLWMIIKREPVFTWAFFETAVLLRTLGEAIATIFLVLALTYASFTEVTAIIQTLPLLMTLMAYLVLKEQIGIHRLLAVALGFVGMLMIVQPGTATFNASSLLAIAAVVGMTIRDLGSRLANKKHSTVRLAIYGTFVQALMGLLLMAFEPAHPAITVTAWLYLLSLVIFAALGIIFITQAMRTGEVSAVAPFRYTRLVFGLIVGVIVFNDQLTSTMLMGSAIILLCGLYVWWRERIHAQ